MTQLREGPLKAGQRALHSELKSGSLSTVAGSGPPMASLEPGEPHNTF